MSGTASARFYFPDWMSDPGVRLSSYAARGLWMDLLCLAAGNREKDYGFVLIGGKNPTPNVLAKLLGGTAAEVKTLLLELEKNSVFSRDRRGLIYCRRMVRTQKARRNGQLGGNPNLLKTNKKRNPVIHPPVMDMVMATAMDSESLSKRKMSRKKIDGKTNLPVDWKPSPDLMAYGRDRGFSDQQIMDTAEDMKTWAFENADGKGRKKIGQQRSKDFYAGVNRMESDMDREDHEHFRTIAAASAAPRRDLPTKPREENLALDRDPQASLKKAEQIFSCYRKDEAHNAEIYAAAVAAVLSQYPKFVTDYVADPRTGIASTSRFLPAVSEIKEACEIKYQSTLRDIERRDRIEKQLIDRDADLAAQLQPRKSYDELKEKHGDGKGGWLDEGGGRKIYTEAEKQAFVENAKQTGKEISDLKMSDELKALIADQTQEILP